MIPPGISYTAGKKRKKVQENFSTMALSTRKDSLNSHDRDVCTSHKVTFVTHLKNE